MSKLIFWTPYRVDSGVTSVITTMKRDTVTREPPPNSDESPLSQTSRMGKVSGNAPVGLISLAPKTPHSKMILHRLTNHVRPRGPETDRNHIQNHQPFPSVFVCQYAKGNRQEQSCGHRWLRSMPHIEGQDGFNHPPGK